MKASASIRNQSSNQCKLPLAPAVDTGWLSVKEAAKLLSVSSATVRRLRETFDPCTRRPFLLSCKPTPRTILISAASVQAHQRASQELEFWDERKKVTLGVKGHHGKRRQRRHRKAECRGNQARAEKRTQRP